MILYYVLRNINKARNQNVQSVDFFPFTLFLLKCNTVKQKMLKTEANQITSIT